MHQSAAREPRLLGHPDTSTIWVLGLLSLFGFVVFGAAGWYFGNRLLAKVDAQPGRWGRRGWVEAGVLMSKIGVGMFPVWLVIWIVAF